MTFYTLIFVTNACFGSSGGSCCSTPSCPPAAMPCGGTYGGSYAAAPTYGGVGK